MLTKRIALLAVVLMGPFTAGAQDLNEDFFAAARKGDTVAVKALLDKGVDVNAKTRYGATALSYACDKGHVEVVKLLIERGADVNSKDTFYGEVPLGWALSHEHVQIVKLLLDKGATGIERALVTGVQAGNVELVKIVLEKGGLKPETLNNALLRASIANKEIVDMLKKAGATAVEVSVDPEILKSYAGVYKNEQIGELTVEIKDGKLVGKLAGQGSFTTSAQSKDTFSILEVEATLTFNSEGGGKVTGFTLKQSGATFVFKRVEQK
jgi:hypothetical protein